MPGVTEVLEGEHRPGHFDGVATVVARLFNQVQPDVAVFGRKDYQQLAVIRYLVRDLAFPVEVVAARRCAKPDGLAMSSRNQYLSAEERPRAAEIQRVLQAMRDAYLAGGDRAEHRSGGARAAAGGRVRCRTTPRCGVPICRLPATGRGRGRADRRPARAAPG